MQQQRNTDSNTKHMEDAKQMIALFNQRIQSLGSIITTATTTSQHHHNPHDTLTNDRLMEYELDGVATQQTIHFWMRVVYYILATYCVVLLWTQWNNTGGLVKKITITVLIAITPYILMPLLRFIIKNIQWVWGLFPTNVRMNIKPV